MGTAPLALINKPELDEVMMLKLQLFSSVARNRQYTMAGPLPISDEAILAHCQLHDLPRQLWPYIAETVQEIDDLWLEDMHENKPAAPAPAPAPSAPKPRGMPRS